MSENNQSKCSAPGPYPPIKVIGKNPFYASLLLDDYAGIVSELSAITQYSYIGVIKINWGSLCGQYAGTDY